MKLVHKFTLWYLAITTVVLLAGGVLVFQSVVYQNDQEEIRRIRGLIDDAVESVRKHHTPDSARSPFVTIRELRTDLPDVPFYTKDTMGYHSTFQGAERQILGAASYRIGDRHFLISARSFAPEPEETIAGVIQSISWIFFALLVVVGVTGVVVSRRILSPFNASLRAMQLFNLKQKKPLVLPQTRTREFAVLNEFLSTMTNKALHDYQALKEFSENASHELQTPLAIIRGKLELLLESDLNDDQIKLIMAAHEAVERLSRTNKALALLTKLENREFETKEVNLSERLQATIEVFRELLEMKTLSITTVIDKGVVVVLNKDLTEILLTNLMSNAIRHNIAGGDIRVTLTREFLEISNTGSPPEVPTEQLFERFRKSNQSSDSTGLGLAIVRRICEISRYPIEYLWIDPRHHIRIKFVGAA